MTTRTEGTKVNPDLGRPIRILLIEDSPSDAAMTIEALKEGRIANEIHTCPDGQSGMDFLRATHDGGAARPDLVLLDLNLPKVDGRQVLAEMKSDDELRTIPVIVLTTSAAEQDILHAYLLNANAYVTKPVGFDPFLAAVRGIEDFWLSVVRLPDGRAA